MLDIGKIVVGLDSLGRKIDAVDTKVGELAAIRGVLESINTTLGQMLALQRNALPGQPEDKPAPATIPSGIPKQAQA